jgi:hypothetical protein
VQPSVKAAPGAQQTSALWKTPQPGQRVRRARSVPVSGSRPKLFACNAEVVRVSNGTCCWCGVAPSEACVCQTVTAGQHWRSSVRHQVAQGEGRTAESRAPHKAQFTSKTAWSRLTPAASRDVVLQAALAHRVVAVNHVAGGLGDVRGAALAKRARLGSAARLACRPLCLWSVFGGGSWGGGLL